MTTEHTCTTCGGTLHAAVIADGYTTHPTCDPAHHAKGTRQ